MVRARLSTLANSEASVVIGGRSSSGRGSLSAEGDLLVVGDCSQMDKAFGLEPDEGDGDENSVLETLGVDHALLPSCD